MTHTELMALVQEVGKVMMSPRHEDEMADVHTVRDCILEVAEARDLSRKDLVELSVYIAKAIAEKKND